MSTASSLREKLRLPIICSPMFIVSNPEMVIAQCQSGVVGTLPALNARPQSELEAWLTRIEAALAHARQDAGKKVAPFGVNIVIRATNDRLDADVECCVAHRVPLVITSLGDPRTIVERVHGYGGLVFHDVTTVRHAQRALNAGVDGLILVCAGAGGHAGATSPFALLAEVRSFYDGPVVLAGAISDGQAVFAAEVMGADFVYMGTRFIATQESAAAPAYKDMIVASSAADVVYTPHFSGIPANYLKGSVVNCGLDPDKLPAVDIQALRASGTGKTRWRDIWGAGQGVGSIHDLPPIPDLVDRIHHEYRSARLHWRQQLDEAEAL
ncbi:MAG: nitronate monooxygenase [Pseudomonadota bacterium]